MSSNHELYEHCWTRSSLNFSSPTKTSLAVPSQTRSNQFKTTGTSSVFQCQPILLPLCVCDAALSEPFLEQNNIAIVLLVCDDAQRTPFHTIELKVPSPTQKLTEVHDVVLQDLLRDLEEAHIFNEDDNASTKGGSSVHGRGRSRGMVLGLSKILLQLDQELNSMLACDCKTKC